MNFNKEFAESILSNVKGDKRFFCIGGQIFQNLEELQKALKFLNEDSFFYHVNNEKNDFASWIYNVLGDIDFAKKINKIRDQKETAKKIKARITYIKKYC